MTKRERAMELFSEGYNCAQAVAGAFQEEVGMDFDTLMKTASAFGGGMGRLREVCGSVSGMFLVTSMLYGYSDPKNFEAKKQLYAQIQQLAYEFKEKNGSYVCRELLNLPEKTSDPTPERRTEAYYKKRPCKELVGDSAEILEKFIEEHN